MKDGILVWEFAVQVLQGELGPLVAYLLLLTLLDYFDPTLLSLVLLV